MQQLTGIKGGAGKYIPEGISDQTPYLSHVIYWLPIFLELVAILYLHIYI
jgi:hypothetical protein